MHRQPPTTTENASGDPDSYRVGTSICPAPLGTSTRRTSRDLSQPLAGAADCCRELQSATLTCQAHVTYKSRRRSVMQPWSLSQAEPQRGRTIREPFWPGSRLRTLLHGRSLHCVNRYSFLLHAQYSSRPLQLHYSVDSFKASTFSLSARSHDSDFREIIKLRPTDPQAECRGCCRSH
jgi:hypothetical protein